MEASSPSDLVADENTSPACETTPADPVGTLAAPHTSAASAGSTGCPAETPEHQHTDTLCGLSAAEDSPQAAAAPASAHASAGPDAQTAAPASAATIGAAGGSGMDASAAETLAPDAEIAAETERLAPEAATPMAAVECELSLDSLPSSASDEAEAAAEAAATIAKQPDPDAASEDVCEVRPTAAAADTRSYELAADNSAAPPPAVGNAEATVNSKTPPADANAADGACSEVTQKLESGTSMLASAADSPAGDLDRCSSAAAAQLPAGDDQSGGRATEAAAATENASGSKVAHDQPDHNSVEAAAAAHVQVRLEVDEFAANHPACYVAVKITCQTAAAAPADGVSAAAAAHCAAAQPGAGAAPGGSSAFALLLPPERTSTGSDAGKSTASAVQEGEVPDGIPEADPPSMSDAGSQPGSTSAMAGGAGAVPKRAKEKRLDCTICKWKGPDSLSHVMSQEHMQRCTQLAGKPICGPCGMKFPNRQHLDTHLRSAKHERRAQQLGADAKEGSPAPQLAPPPGLQQPNGQAPGGLSHGTAPAAAAPDAATTAAAADAPHLAEPAGCGGKVVEGNLALCAVCHWKGPIARIVAHFTSQAHRTKCAKAEARSVPVCVECGYIQSGGDSNLLAAHRGSKSHSDRMAWLQPSASGAATAAASSAGAASSLAAGSSSATDPATASEAARRADAPDAAPAGAQWAAGVPVLSAAAVKVVELAASNAGVGCGVCQLKGAQTPEHFQSATHAAACRRPPSGSKQRVCSHCGMQFPNDRHLLDHATHPKHAAQMAWLAGEEPAAILAAAEAAAAARAAAVAQLSGSQRQQVDGQHMAADDPAAQEQAAQPAVHQQPGLPQAARSAAPAAEPGHPAAAAVPSSHAAGAGPGPVATVAAAARPTSAGLVQGCGVCGVVGELPVSHFVGKQHIRSCTASTKAGRLVCSACGEAAADAAALAAHNRTPAHYRRIAMIRRHQAEAGASAAPAAAAGPVVSPTAAAARAAAAAALRPLPAGSGNSTAAPDVRAPAQHVPPAAPAAPPGRLVGSAIAAAAHDRQSPTGPPAPRPLSRGPVVQGPLQQQQHHHHHQQQAAANTNVQPSRSGSGTAAPAGQQQAAGEQSHWRCAVCSWTGLQPAAAVKHFQSSEHLTSCITAGSTVCSDCGVKFVDRSTLQQHRRGTNHSSHVAALAAAQKQAQAPPQPPAQQPQQRPHLPAQYQQQQQQKSQQGYVQPAAQPFGQAAAAQRPPQQENAHHIDCGICRWSSDIPTEAVAHFKSQGHEDACRRGGYFCSPCGLRLSRYSDLGPHRQTQMHWQRVGWLKAAGGRHAYAAGGNPAVTAPQDAERPAAAASPAASAAVPQPAAPQPLEASQQPPAVPRAMQAAALQFAEEQWRQQQEGSSVQLHFHQQQQPQPQPQQQQHPATPIVNSGLPKPHAMQQQQQAAQQTPQHSVSTESRGPALPRQGAVQQADGQQQEQQLQQQRFRQMALAAQQHQAAALQRMQQHQEQFTRQQEARDHVMQNQQALRQALYRQQSDQSAPSSQQQVPAHVQQQQQLMPEQRSHAHSDSGNTLPSQDGSMQEAMQQQQRLLEQHQQMAQAAQQHQAASQQLMQQHREQVTRQQEARDHVMQNQQSLRQALRQQQHDQSTPVPQQPMASRRQQPLVPQHDGPSEQQPTSAQSQQQQQQQQARPQQQLGSSGSPPLPEPLPPAAPPHPVADKPQPSAGQVPPQWELLTEAADAVDAAATQSDTLQPHPQQPQLQASRYQPPHLRRQHSGASATHPVAANAPQAEPWTALASTPAAAEMAEAVAGSSALPGVTSAAGSSSSTVPRSNGAAVNVNDDFICPITHCVFRDPVICADGFSYERTAIATWLQRSDVSPMTNQPLEHRGLVPNRALKNLIAANEMLKHQRS